MPLIRLRHSIASRCGQFLRHWLLRAGQTSQEPVRSFQEPVRQRRTRHECNQRSQFRISLCWLEARPGAGVELASFEAAGAKGAAFARSPIDGSGQEGGATPPSRAFSLLNAPQLFEQLFNPRSVFLLSLLFHHGIVKVVDGESLRSNHRGHPGPSGHQKRREGVTIPSVSARTPPAGYKAAAPPRRGPLSLASGATRYRWIFACCNMAWLGNLWPFDHRSTLEAPIIKDAASFQGFA